MSEFVYNDIYGNESARQRYNSDSRYAYYNTVLRMHNRYFQNDQLHDNIFHRQKADNRSTLQNYRPQTNYDYYSLQKINNLTFRINKTRKVPRLPMTQLRMHSIQGKKTEQRNRNILRDAESIRSAIKQGFKKNQNGSKSPSFRIQINTSLANRKPLE